MIDSLDSLSSWAVALRFWRVWFVPLECAEEMDCILAMQITLSLSGCLECCRYRCLSRSVHENLIVTHWNIAYSGFYMRWSDVPLLFWALCAFSESVVSVLTWSVVSVLTWSVVSVLTWSVSVVSVLTSPDQWCLSWPDQCQWCLSWPDSKGPEVRAGMLPWGNGSSEPLSLKCPKSCAVGCFAFHCCLIFIQSLASLLIWTRQMRGFGAARVVFSSSYEAEGQAVSSTIKLLGSQYLWTSDSI